MDKAQLRKQLRAKREQLSVKYRQKADSAIYSKLIDNSHIKNANVIMTYVSMGSEADTHLLIERLISDGKKAAVPVVCKKELEVSYITSLDVLELSSYGILEPKKGLFNRCKPSDIEVIIVPGIAFDTSGHRIGYGAGYYDRFLPKTNAVKIGICHDACLVDSVSPHEHDVAVDYIITDLREIY